MKKIIILFTLALCSCSLYTYGQRIGTPAYQKIIAGTNVEKLQESSERLKIKAEQEYQQAIQKAILNRWPIRIEQEDGKIIQLIRLDANGNPVYYATDNVIAAAVIGTDNLHAAPFNLQGNGMRIGEWDGGSVRDTHEQFIGRVTNHDGGSSNWHATHVCGTLIGDGTGNANARGMTPLATVDAYDFIGDEAEMTAEAAIALLISNHSYGTISGWYEPSPGVFHWYGDTTINNDESHYFGWYNSTAAQWDDIAFNAPFYLIVKSAGNDRNDFAPPLGTAHSHNGMDTFFDTHANDGNNGTGYDCIATSGTSKNILTVGAIEDDGTTMSTFSGWGPTDDGRIKPDIVANGVGLLSSYHTADNAYASSDGTSMSSPSVAGSCILLQEHYQNINSSNSMRSATLKALVIHTADDILAPGPDYQSGWGRMNSLAAAELITENGQNDQHIVEETLGDGEAYNFVGISNGNSIEVTLCWTDVPGTAQLPGHDITTSNLINDLDIRVVSASGTEFPYILDPVTPGVAATTGDNFRDNVEKIQIPFPVMGNEYTITVAHKGNLSGGSQNFSLIVSGITITPCSSDIIITGNNYNTALTESDTWIVSSGQTTIENTADVRLDADPISGYIEFEPVVGADFFLAEPIGDGVFVAEALDGCNIAIPAKMENTNDLFVGNDIKNTHENIVENTVPEGFLLEQNIPNPFSETTTIKASVPDGITHAKIVIYSLQGIEVASYPLNKRGTITVEISAGKLAAGVYFYTLVADGRNIDAKKMILTK